MPPLGKPQSNQPRKPFDLAAHHHGEQVDSVRSKIASLMDGVTEKQASAKEATTKEATTKEATTKEATTKEATTKEQAEVEVKIPAEETRTRGIPVDGSATAPPSVAQSAPIEADPWGTTTNTDRPGAGFPVEESKRMPDGAVRNGFHETGTSHSIHPSSEAATPSVQFSTDEEPTSWPRRTERPAPPVEQADEPRHYDYEQNGWEQAPPPSSTAGPGPTPAAAINIKGRSGGILIEIGRGPWPDLMVALAERLTGAANFFRNGSAAIDLAVRSLTETELGQLRTMLEEQALELVLIRTASPETFQVALDMGLSAQLETTEGDTTATAHPALSNLLQEQHFVYAGHLRAGQVLHRKEHILVIGDVNPGATVISNGDILVWGHLRGVAHAGAGGDERAVICALDLTPVQIRIGDLIAIAPEPEKPKRSWRRRQTPAKQPEIAYTTGDRINVEPWDATKFGGIAAFRRQ